MNRWASSFLKNGSAATVTLLLQICSPAHAANKFENDSRWAVFSVRTEDGKVLQLSAPWMIFSVGVQESLPIISVISDGCNDHTVKLAYLGSNKIVLSESASTTRPCHGLNRKVIDFAFRHLVGTEHTIDQVIDPQIVSLDGGRIILRNANSLDLTPTDDYRRGELLTQQLLSLEANNARHNPDNSIQLFNANTNLILGDFDWRAEIHQVVNCGAVPVNINISAEGCRGNGSNVFFTCRRTDVQRTSIKWQTKGPTQQCSPEPLKWGARGTLTIPKCEFNYFSNPTCYPSVKIFNSKDNPQNVVFQATQPGRQAKTIRPGESVEIDRSEGDITVTLLQFEAVTFAVQIDFELNGGPDAKLDEKATTTPDRWKTYERLADLNDQLFALRHSVDNNGQVIDPILSIRLEELTTAIHILSAEAVKAGYQNNVKDLLLQSAQYLLDIDDISANIRNQVIASTEITVSDVEALIKRIEIILADPNLPKSDDGLLDSIRTELLRARDAAGSDAKTVYLLRGHFKGSIDRQLRDYQLNILEYAQYVTPQELSELQGTNIKNQIATKFSPSDIVISDDVLNGKGFAIRQAAGLPNSPF